MKKDDSVKSEYNEILNFVAELEEECLTSSDLILANKKELQYKKRQKELLIEEQDKKRNPNIEIITERVNPDGTKERVISFSPSTSSMPTKLP